MATGNGDFSPNEEPVQHQHLSASLPYGTNHQRYYQEGEHQHWSDASISHQHDRRLFTTLGPPSTGSFQGLSQDHGSDHQERMDPVREQEREWDHSGPTRNWTRQISIVKQPEVEAHVLDHASFSGRITGETAEQKLEQRGEPCYLTRYSIKNKCYILSTMTRNKEGQIQFDHFAIDVMNDRYKVRGENQSFEMIGDMLDYYEKNPIGTNVEYIGRAAQEASQEGIQKQLKQPPQQEGEKDKLFLEYIEKQRQEYIHLLHEKEKKLHEYELREQEQKYRRELDEQKGEIHKLAEEVKKLQQERVAPQPQEAAAEQIVNQILQRLPQPPPPQPQQQQQQPRQVVVQNEPRENPPPQEKKGCIIL